MVESQPSAPRSLRDSGITGVANTMPTDPLHEAREPERRAKSAPRPALIFVVSRDALDHYEYLKRAFAGDDRVSVVLDRRSGERRKASSAREGDRRRADRRSRRLIDDRVRRQGWAMVRVEPM